VIEDEALLRGGVFAVAFATRLRAALPRDRRAVRAARFFGAAFFAAGLPAWRTPLAFLIGVPSAASKA
jgi:hypothetical protein